MCYIHAANWYCSPCLALIGLTEPGPRLLIAVILHKHNIAHVSCWTGTIINTDQKIYVSFPNKALDAK